MDRTVRIMEVELNILDDEQLEEKVRKCFDNDYLNVILLASQKLLFRAAESPGFRELLLRADLILPGEEALLSLHHGEELKKDGIIVNYRCLQGLLLAFQGEKKTVYTVSDSEQHIQLIENFFRLFRSDMVLVGSASEADATDESIINEINSLAPDVLLVDMEVPKQEEWIMAHAALLNSKLCIGLGGVMELMITEYKQEPAWVSKLGLSRIYNTLIRRNHYKRLRKEKSFQLRLHEYRRGKRGNNK